MCTTAEHNQVKSHVAPRVWQALHYLRTRRVVSSVPSATPSTRDTVAGEGGIYAWAGQPALPAPLIGRAREPMRERAIISANGGAVPVQHV